jgi:PD-(D/E)XK nuclease superfamily
VPAGPSAAAAAGVPSMRSVPTRTARTLADVLDLVAAGPVAPDHDESGEGVPGTLRAVLDDAAGRAGRVGGWTGDDPLRLSKGPVTWLLRCPRRALAGAGAAATDDMVVGLAVDAAAKLATLASRHPVTVEAVLGYLAASGDTRVGDHLDHLGAAAAPLLADIEARVQRLVAAWPAIDPAWWPRVEEPVRVRLAGGAVVVSGRLDLLLGGPPTDRPAVVVEVKAGRWHDGMRADGHLYALVVSLRDGRPPAAIVTVVADGTTQVEPVRPAVLETAADRVEQALAVAAPIAAGEPPAARPGPHCTHCPVRPGCDVGRDWRPAEPVPAGGRAGHLVSGP